MENTSRILNDESDKIQTGTWRIKKPVWIKSACVQCGLCWPVCPDDSIPIDSKACQRKDFDYEYCKGCGICAKVCPFKAIKMEDNDYEEQEN